MWLRDSKEKLRCGLLSACSEFRFPGPTPDLQNQNLHCNRIPEHWVHNNVYEALCPHTSGSQNWLCIRNIVVAHTPEDFIRNSGGGTWAMILIRGQGWNNCSGPHCLVVRGWLTCVLVSPGAS